MPGSCTPLNCSAPALHRRSGKKLFSADPKAEQCGWLKDKFGLSWQIVPTVMDEMLQDKNETGLARVTENVSQNEKV
jgi:predicted 3-demethylubiquinone-9 3-methyltransferase (glyoxalase superfamily)